MPINAPSDNGTRTKPEPRHECLAFADVEQNSYGRASVNSAWTHRRTTGQYDCALILFDQLCSELRSRAPAENIDIDALSCHAIEPIVQQRLQGVPELTENVTDDLSRSQQLLRDLLARKPTKLVRSLREIAAAAVADAISPIRLGLDNVFAQAPYTFADLASELQRTLSDIPISLPDFKPHKRFANAIRALAALARFPSLAGRLRDGIMLTLRKRCEADFQATLEAVVQDYCGSALRDAVTELAPYLAELRQRQAAFRRNVDAAKGHLDEARIAARQRSVHSRSSVLLELETPDSDQLLTGIRDRHRCQDRRELNQLFEEKLIDSLNASARLRHPHVRTPATLADLIVQLPPRETAVGVLDVVAGLIGDVHTIYTAVRTCGVRRVAEELFERAGPLCHLDSRDHIRLNVETHRDLIVRLPRPRGADDAEIAEQLRETFRELQPTCQFLEDPVDAEITAVRTLVGFPIGIEATNLPMLIDYAASKSQGHHPHLFGLLPESPEGEHIPRLLALANHHLTA